MFSLKIQGGPQLAKALDGLGFTKQRSVLTDILKKGAEPYKAGMERHAPVEPGKPDLKDHIAISTASEVSSPETIGSRKRDEGEAVVAVGPEKGFFYGLFQEYGFIHAGNPEEPVSAQPFMRPAFDEGTTDALKVIQERMWTEIRKNAERSTSGRNL